MSEGAGILPRMSLTAVDQPGASELKPPRKKTLYYPTLDGWRAIAILTVLAGHGNVRSIDFAARGVQLFFGLSGLLICSLLLNEKRQSGHISLRRFYLRRAFRILPASLLYLAVVSALALGGAIAVKPGEIAACLAFYRNYYVSFHATHPAEIGRYTLHFWSLSVEEQFYFLSPLGLLLLSRRTLGVLLPTLGIFVAVWRGIDSHLLLAQRVVPGLSFAIERTDLCIDYLIWGCWCAVINDAAPFRPRLSAALSSWHLQGVLILVLVSTLVVKVPGAETIFAVLMPVLLLCTMHRPDTPLGRLLEWTPLRWLGGLSYSLYLWQQMFLVQHGLESGTRATWLMTLQRPPVNFICALSLAMLSLYLVEGPIRRFGYRRAGSRSPTGEGIAAPGTGAGH